MGRGPFLVGRTCSHHSRKMGPNIPVEASCHLECSGPCTCWKEQCARCGVLLLFSYGLYLFKNNYNYNMKSVIILARMVPPSTVDTRLLAGCPLGQMVPKWERSSRAVGVMRVSLETQALWYIQAVTPSCQSAKHWTMASSTASVSLAMTDAVEEETELHLNLKKLDGVVSALYPSISDVLGYSPIISAIKLAANKSYCSMRVVRCVLFGC